MARYRKRRIGRKRRKTVRVRLAKRRRVIRTSRSLLRVAKPELKKLTAESSYTGFNPQISAGGDILNVLPQIPQGTNDGQRIGNKIKVQRIEIRGVITMTFPNTSTTYSKLGIRHMVLRKRAIGNWINVAAGDLSTLVERGAGPSYYLGFIQDQLSEINKRSYAVGMDRKYNVTTPTVLTSTGTLDAPNQTVTKRFRITLGKGMTLKYETGNSNPENWPWFMCLGWCKWDGTIPSSLDTNINMQYQTTIYYYDN